MDSNYYIIYAKELIILKKPIIVIILLIACVFALGCLESRTEMSPPSPSPTGGLSKCERMQDLNERSACLLEMASFNDDPGLCAKMPIIYTADDCYAYFANKRGDENFCYNIQGDLKADCISKIALGKQDFGLCSEIEDEGKNKECMEEIGKSQPDLCGKMPTAAEKDDCMFKAATQNNSTVLCNRIQNPDAIFRCLLFVSPGEITMDLCNKTTSPDPRVDCYKNRGIYAGDFSACMIINDWLVKGECLNQLAIMTKNATVCKSLDSEKKTNACIEAVNKAG
ncbi:MAG: hypothetical protein V1835_06605 [Candidatus Micrarchaeota archaeon]